MDTYPENFVKSESKLSPSTFTYLEFYKRLRKTRLHSVYRSIAWKWQYFHDMRKISSGSFGFFQMLYDLISKKQKVRNYEYWSEYPKLMAEKSFGIKFPEGTPAYALGEVIRDGVYFGYKNFLPEKGSVVYDVGAQYGDFSLMCSKIFSVGKVISFEPLTDIFDLFNETVKMNSLDNIEVNNAAVCSADGEIRIFRNRDMAAKAGVDSHIIKSVKLDSVCNEKVDLLKIDVEGWEMDVLEGATGLISEYHPKIIIETHSLMLKNEVIAFLELFGYKVVHEGRTLYSEAADMDFVQNLYLS